MAPMRTVRPMTRKVSLIVVAGLAVFGGLGIGLLALKLQADALAAARRDLEAAAGLLEQAIGKVMLAGQAPIAVSLLDGMRGRSADEDIRLLRASGVEAFCDNATIAQVNRKMGRTAFADKAVLPQNPTRIPPDEPAFAASVGEAGSVFAAEVGFERGSLTIYRAIANGGGCADCHGSDHAVRGVIRVRRDLTPAVVEGRWNLALAGAVLAAVAALLAGTVSACIRRGVVDPLRQIGDVCAMVSGGELGARVAIRSRNEVGVLADGVNEMIEGLHERFELATLASSPALRSVRNAEKGAKVRLTLLFADVRGFAAYAERHSAEEAVASLNRVLDAQTDIIRRCGGEVGKYVGTEVIALFSGADQAFRACAAALEIQREVAKSGGETYGGLQVAISIDTGEVVVGLIGGSRRADFAVVGDRVNLAARLCAAVRPAQVIVSDAAWKAAGGRVPARGPYGVRVGDKADPQRVYLLEGQGTRA